MSYLVLARKYRPRRFDEVAGQPAVAMTLKNAIRLDRIAHAYLFAGPRGVGKTSLARILAATLCCEKAAKTRASDPCGACDRCVAIQRGNDLDVVEIDAASNRGIDDIRQLRDKARVAPMRGDRKVYIVDECHQLTSEAFNALLKTLEEPPAHVLFVLATTELERVPDTIRSRCQTFEFRRVPDGEIAARLKAICAAEKIDAEDAALAAVARAARGGMRDAQSLLDQLITLGGGAVKLADVRAVTGALGPEAVGRLLDVTIGGDLAGVIAEVDRLDRAGIGANEVLDALLEQLRDLQIACAIGANAPLESSGADRERIERHARALDVDRALQFTNLALHARRRLRDHDDPRVLLETTLLRMARIANLIPIADALATLAGEVRPAAPNAPGSAPPRSAAPASIASAPAATPAASPAPATSSGAAAPGAPNSDPAAIHAAIVADVARTNPSVAPWLRSFAPHAFDGATLELTAGTSGPSVYTLADARVRGILEQATRRLFGRPIALKLVGGAGAASKADPEDGARKAVERAKDLFDGDVIN